MATHNAIAKHDSVHCNVPGLFASFKKGSKPGFEIKYKHGADDIEFIGPKQLGALDLLVLQGLISLAGRAKTALILKPNPETEDGQAARDKLEITGEAKKQNAIVVKCPYKTFFDEIDVKVGGSQIKALRACLKRLYTVSIFVTIDGEESGYRLLSQYKSNDTSLFVGLNPMIALAVTGGTWIKINMSEVRAIKLDATRFIHQRLCGYVWPGESSYIGIDTLAGYIYIDVSTNTNTIKTRRQQVRKALTELQGLGWSVIEADGKFKIGRP